MPEENITHFDRDWKCFANEDGQFLVSKCPNRGGSEAFEGGLRVWNCDVKKHSLGGQGECDFHGCDYRDCPVYKSKSR